MISTGLIIISFFLRPVPGRGDLRPNQEKGTQMKNQTTSVINKSDGSGNWNEFSAPSDQSAPCKNPTRFQFPDSIQMGLRMDFSVRQRPLRGACPICSRKSSTITSTSN